MTPQEFSDEFDTLIGAYATTLPSTIPGSLLEFDEYEKSCFLTNAQEAIVTTLYSANQGAGFETSEEVRRYLDRIIVTAEPKEIDVMPKIKDKFIHTQYLLPCDIWYIVYEEATYSGEGSCYANAVADIVPVTMDGYNRTIANPFRGPKLERVLRVDSGVNTVELVSTRPLARYYIKYLRKPLPIITAPLDGVTINGFSDISGCELNSSIHRRILEAAVRLAINSRVSGKKQD